MTEHAGVRGWRGAGRRLAAAALVFAAAAAAVPAGPVAAAEPTVFGVPVVAHRGMYVVQSTVNVRALPKTSGARIGKLEKGEQVEVMARTKGGNWLVVLDNGKPNGFVWAKVMMPLVEGGLAEELKGEAAVPGVGTCGYRIRFAGKTPLEGQPYEVADYDVDVECKAVKPPLAFPMQMFLTEAPYQLTRKKRVFQLNADLLDDFHAGDEVLSAIFLFDLDNARVKLDGVNLKPCRRAKPEVTEQPATGVAEALKAALEMALAAWSDKVWVDIAKAGE